MKKIILFSLISLSLTNVFAQEIYEPFSGSGNLTSNGWINHSGSSNPSQIIETTGDSGNSLSYTGLISSGNRASITAGGAEDVNKAFTANTSVIYYSLLIKVKNTDGLSVSGDFPFCLAQSSGSSGVTAFRAKIYLKTGTSANTYNIGVENSTGGTYTPTFIATDFPVNTTIFVVVKHVVATNTSYLWLNPVFGASEPSANVSNSSGTTATSSLQSICIRQNGNSSSGTGNVEFDEIRVANNWSDVTSNSGLGVNDIKADNTRIVSNTLLKDDVSILLDGRSLVEFYDLAGALVKTTAVGKNEKINVSNLKGGVYLLKVSNSNTTRTIKVIKH